MPDTRQSDTEVPLSGAIPVAAGQPSVVRVPVPGTNGFAVELWPRNYQGKSTSTLFVQDVDGRRVLRLDYGWNKTTKSVDYHWNQQRAFSTFGIPDHTTVGRAGRRAYQAARAYRGAGRTLVVVGVGLDVASIVLADRPLRRATAVASAWALAWVGCKGVGALGAYGGSFVGPLGTAGGAIVGCIAGGYGGYRGGEALGEAVYEWAEGTVFTRLPEIPVP
jgi:hypothetical protein